MRLYQYVGPGRLQARNHEQVPRVSIFSSKDVYNWVVKCQELSHDKTVTATYIVDAEGQLWITDRHYEHVSCARGKEVLAAGEISFLVMNQDVEVVYSSNQSTGYCPKVDSWSFLTQCLQKAKIPHPESFSLALTFSKCSYCGQINIIKNEVFECSVCEKALK